MPFGGRYPEHEEEAYLPYYAMDHDAVDPSMRTSGREARSPSGLSLPIGGGGRRLYVLPERGLLRLVPHTVIASILLVAFLYMVVSNASDIDTPLDMLLAIVLPLLPALYIFFLYWTREYIAIYEDRVVVNRRSYPRDAVHWVDAHKVRDYVGRVRIGRSTTPIIEDFYELVFTVTEAGHDTEHKVTVGMEDHQVSLATHELRELLPNLRVTIHEGIEDRVPTAMKAMWGPEK